MPRRKAGQLFPKEATFVEKMGADGLSRVPAAAAAGFADPSSEAARLLARPEVRDRIIELLQRKAVKWVQLLDWSLQRLQDVIAPVPVICTHQCSCGQSCGNVVWTPPLLKPETVLYATKITLDSMQKMGLSNTLRGRAEKEDEGTRESVVARMLGKRPGVIDVTEPARAPEE